MHRTLFFMLAACVLTGAAPALAAAQGREHAFSTPSSVVPLVADITGIVLDDAGDSVPGVSVLAIGTSLAIVHTDDWGRFALRLSPGTYVLRATRDGYVSTYRESIRLVAGGAERRSITLTRAAGQPAVRLASVVGGSEAAVPEPPPSAPLPVSEGSQTATSWRLRHLPKTVLRDGTDPLLGDSDGLPWAVDRRSLFETIAGNPARATASFLTETDFTGHLDFLTTSSLSATAQFEPVDWPRGVAYVVLGAPVGARGDWTVRAALTAGDLTSWIFLGEYQARAGRDHAFRTGVSYSAQMPTQVLTIDPASTPPASRRVGGVYLTDRWTFTPRFEFNYGVKLDRYDYLVDPNLVSGSFGARVRIAPHTAVVASMSPHMTAPGADEFLPPAAAGVWLPPQRTFAPLIARDALRPERVDRYDLMLETRLTSAESGPVARAGVFSEAVTDQIATIFGLDGAGATGHYAISSPGDVRVDGWVAGIGGRMTKFVHGYVDYRSTRADWTGDAARGLRKILPSAARRGIEQGHDLTTSVEASVPRTATRLTVAYRLNSAFASLQAAPVPASRFKVEVAQQLGFRPMGRGDLNLLVSARTLLRELGEEEAYFDDLLTVDPPLCLTFGLQMRF